MELVQYHFGCQGNLPTCLKALILCVAVTMQHVWLIARQAVAASSLILLLHIQMRWSFRHQADMVVTTAILSAARSRRAARDGNMNWYWSCVGWLFFSDKIWEKCHCCVEKTKIANIFKYRSSDADIQIQHCGKLHYINTETILSLSWTLWDMPCPAVQVKNNRPLHTSAVQNLAFCSSK